MKQLLFIPFVLLCFSIPRGATFYQNNNETNHDRSLLRTISIIEQRTEVGRLVLLVCGRKKICQKSRSEIPQWIRDYNEEKGYTGYELIHYHFYIMGQQLPILVDAKLRSFPSLVYIIAKTPYVFTGNVNNQSSVHSWLKEMDGLYIQQPRTYDQLEEMFSNVDDENCTSKYLLLLNDEKKCPFPTWPVIARHLGTTHGITPVQIDEPIPTEISVVLRKRMPEFLFSTCRNLVLVAFNSYAIPPDSPIPEVLSEWVEYHFPYQNNCFSLDSSVWFSILPQLTELELIFFSGEQKLGALEHNWSYIWIGVVGGCAVCTLAFSIFWGLNGSAFAK